MSRLQPDRRVGFGAGAPNGIDRYAGSAATRAAHDVSGPARGQGPAVTGCSLAVEAFMDPILHRDAGAPSTVWTMLDLSPTPMAAHTNQQGGDGDGGKDGARRGTNGIAIEMEVRMFNKTATRLPESIFVVFRPAFVPGEAGRPKSAAQASWEDVRTPRHQKLMPAPSSHGWRLEMFNMSSITLDPTDVLVDGNGSGGAPHTRCVSGVTHYGPRYTGTGTDAGPELGLGSTGALTLTSADVPCLSTGAASPFPTPRDTPPDMRLGVSYNVFNNIWNTNYVLWYPFDQADKDIKVRFSLQLSDSAE